MAPSRLLVLWKTALPHQKPFPPKQIRNPIPCLLPPVRCRRRRYLSPSVSGRAGGGSARMFYSHTILARKSPLGTVWIAAHLERKIKKPQIESIDIPSYAGPSASPLPRSKTSFFSSLVSR